MVRLGAVGRSLVESCAEAQPLPLHNVDVIAWAVGRHETARIGTAHGDGNRHHVCPILSPARMTALLPLPELAAGQLWRCKGRNPAEVPLVLINRIDQHPLDGEIYHVSITGVQIRNPSAPGGLVTALPHIPVIRQTFQRSEAEFVRLQEPDPAYLEGYAQWKSEFEAGTAGSFGVAFAEVLDFIERALASRPS
jgi:hypothetical protein